MSAQSYGARLRNDPEAQRIVRFKAGLYRNLRNFLDAEGAIELPMPILWRTREGAPCDQWRTTDPVTGESWFIRHCMEDHLRRMTPVFPRIFELGKAIRAERKTEWHATEFTVLEVALSDVDYETGIDLLLRLLNGPVAASVRAEFGDEPADVFTSVGRTTWDHLAAAVVGVAPSSDDFTAACIKWLVQQGISTDHYTYAWESLEDLMKHGIEPACSQPTLISDFPRDLQHVCALGSNGRAQRLSFVMNGVEFADGGVKFAEASEYRRIYESNARYRSDVLGLDMNDLPDDFFAELSAVSQNVFTCGIGLDRLSGLVAGRNVHSVIQFPEG